jgi:hypothetical protein
VLDELWTTRGMKKVLITFLYLTFIVPQLSALTITPGGSSPEDSSTRIQEAGDEQTADLDSQQGDYYNVANQVHARITEVTNDNKGDHWLIRVHWTVDAEVWLQAFKLRFTYFDENRKPIKTEERWMYSPDEGGSFNTIAPHSQLAEWHEFSLPTDDASKLKSVNVEVDLAYASD